MFGPRCFRPLTCRHSLNAPTSRLVPGARLPKRSAFTFPCHVQGPLPAPPPKKIVSKGPSSRNIKSATTTPTLPLLPHTHAVTHKFRFERIRPFLQTSSFIPTLLSTPILFNVMALLPMAMYGLEVPPGDVAIMAHADIPASFRVTMAAIDPSAEPEGDDGEVARPRATLKVLRLPLGEDDDDSDDDLDIDELDAQFGESDSEEDSEDDDDEDLNGGPSDPAKSKKARQEAAAAQIKQLLMDEGMDVDDDEDDEDIPNGINGTTKSSKALGKLPKGDDDEDEDEDDSDLDEDDMGAEIEEFVICTLDPEKVSSLRCTVHLRGSILTSFKELPANPRPHLRRRRACLVQGHRHPHHIPHWQLRRARPRSFRLVRPGQR